MMPVEIPVHDLKLLLKAAESPSGDLPSKRVLQQVDLCGFYGARCWAILHPRGFLISFNMTKLGKRKKNAWEPYANWYLAYTILSQRRKGYAKTLGYHVRGIAQEAGCVRIRSLAGSWAGLCMHASLGDHFWGLTSKPEVVVDSPLVDRQFPDGIPGAVRNAMRESPGEPSRITKEDIELLTGGKLCYDL